MREDLLQSSPLFFLYIQGLERIESLESFSPVFVSSIFSAER